MDQGTRLALVAILHGLRKSGQLSGHALTVITDELRYAARDARDLLLDYEGAQIEQLSHDLNPADTLSQAAENRHPAVLAVERVRPR